MGLTDFEIPLSELEQGLEGLGERERVLTIFRRLLPDELFTEALIDAAAAIHREYRNPHGQGYQGIAPTWFVWCVDYREGAAGLKLIILELEVGTAFSDIRFRNLCALKTGLAVLNEGLTPVAAIFAVEALMRVENLEDDTPQGRQAQVERIKNQTRERRLDPATSEEVVFLSAVASDHRCRMAKLAVAQEGNRKQLGQAIILPDEWEATTPNELFFQAMANPAEAERRIARLTFELREAGYDVSD